MLRQAEIEIGIYEDFINNPTHYKIENGEIVLNENWEQEEKEKEMERVAKLHITKLDFYNNLIKPAEISYSDLIAKIVEVGMQAEWELCNHVYYGVIKPFLNVLPLNKTEDEIIKIFEELTPEE